jgi:hypothetical protein
MQFKDVRVVFLELCFVLFSPYKKTNCCGFHDHYKELRTCNDCCITFIMKCMVTYGGRRSDLVVDVVLACSRKKIHIQ